MNSLLYYYNNVQKMIAYRLSKRMQRGALSAQGGFSTNNPALRQIPCTIQCIFVVKDTISGTQSVFSTSGSGDTPYIRIIDTEIAIFASNLKLYSYNLTVGHLNDIVFVCTNYDISIFVNGILKANTSYSNSMTYYNIGFFVGNQYYFQGEYLLHRHFNYAMSEDEVKALDNNGDPMGYVVPSNYKILGDAYLSDFSEGADGWYVTPLTDYVTITVSDGAVVVSKDSANQNMIIGRSHSPYNVQISNYSVQLKFSEPLPSQVMSIAVRPFNSISGVTLNISSDRLTASGIFINSTSKPNGSSLIIFRATGPVSIPISSISFTPSVCLAEYLPQNLMYGRDDKSIATSWLDSAKQLPLSDEYMEPLFQSIGGYDMAASGAPEILYNE